MNLFNQLVVKGMPVVPKSIVGKVASRYIAGEQVEDAISKVKELNSEGAMATVDLVGEHSGTPETAIEAFEIYIKVLNEIDSHKLDANISIKPTHIGLSVSYDFLYEQVSKLAIHADKLNNFMRIDMENAPYTDDIYRLFFNLKEKYDNLGIVIQAYLRRTVRDIEKLMDTKSNIRICKGIYNESRQIAFKSRQIIINNYAMLLHELLENNCYVGIATHCEETIWHALRIIRQLALNRDQYEFQMLLGVDHDLMRILLNDGHRVRIYVPFGEEWYPYSLRRLTENPTLAGSIAREVLGFSKNSN